MNKPLNCTEIHFKVGAKMSLFFFCLLVRKPQNAKTIQDQTKLVTKNAFEIIYNLRTHIKDYLLSGGYIYNLQYPDHKWKFNNAGKKIKNFLHRVKIVTSLWVLMEHPYLITYFL